MISKCIFKILISSALRKVNFSLLQKMSSLLMTLCTTNLNEELEFNLKLITNEL